MVSGKAASGKSTFMKYIANHHKTREALESWSSGQKLVVTSFYFWNSGTPMQRSKDDLRQKLPYQILCAAPELIVTFVPQQMRDTVARSHTDKPWPRKACFGHNIFRDIQR